MKVLDGTLQGLLIIEPDVFKDKRGFFVETFHEERYRASGIDAVFVQDNLSYSVRRTLRGLHYQHPHAQGKLIQALSGEIFDVAVDIRSGSPTFAQWMGVRISGENKRQVYIPQGFAHGFCVLSETAHVMYKCTDFYAPDSERGILWCDGDLGIEWPVKEPVVSDKDGDYPLLKDIPPELLPVYKADA
ncbi:MAG: dTDP-4-dehydrorhamnose 3,5-epimerase [Desulfobacterales bacterium]|nr:dTDP-4-dehydrorhamnose 3,5-epimerase [Desulfobacterales bacterium]